MSEIDWGREISVKGKKPQWLADGEPVRIGWCHGDYINWSNPHAWTAKAVTDDTYEGRGWGNVSAIMLPSAHYAYRALDAGFTPWGGGDTAPEDWDGGEVLFRSGITDKSEEDSWDWQATNSESDIIGYHKKQTPIDQDTVTVKRLTEDEWRELWKRANGAIRGEYLIAGLRELGLVREETRSERFTRTTGHTLTPAVEAALEWER